MKNRYHTMSRLEQLTMGNPPSISISRRTSPLKQNQIYFQSDWKSYFIFNLVENQKPIEGVQQGLVGCDWLNGWGDI